MKSSHTRSLGRTIIGIITVALGVMFGALSIIGIVNTPDVISAKAGVALSAILPYLGEGLLACIFVVFGLGISTSIFEPLNAKRAE